MVFPIMLKPDLLPFISSAEPTLYKIKFYAYFYSMDMI